MAATRLAAETPAGLLGACRSIQNPNDLLCDVDAGRGVDRLLKNDVVLLSLGDLTNRPVRTLHHRSELLVAALVQVFTELALAALKIALNTFSSCVMVRLHKVYGNLMVDLRATNAKLVQRALRLTMRAADADEAAANLALQACGWRVKTAVVM